MANKSYNEKLKDPRWQKKRLEILERDDWSCRYCGDKTTTLHVHHERYEGEPWGISPEHLTSVCEHCHGILEYLKKELPPCGVEKIIKHPYTEGIDDFLIFVFIRGGKNPAITIFELVGGIYTLTGLLFQKHIDSILALNKLF